MYRDVKSFTSFLPRRNPVGAKFPTGLFEVTQDSNLHIPQIYCNRLPSTNRGAGAMLDSHVHPLNRTLRRWVTLNSAVLRDGVLGWLNDRRTTITTILRRNPGRQKYFFLLILSSHPAENTFYASSPPCEHFTLLQLNVRECVLLCFTRFLG